MTIFLEIIKKRLDKVIDDIKETSYRNDASVFNKLANTIHKGRNPELSQKKRAHADKLLENIKLLTDQSSDEKTYNALIAIMEKSKKDAKGLAKNSSCSNEGNFGRAIDNAIKLIQDIYIRLKIAYFPASYLLKVSFDPCKYYLKKHDELEFIEKSKTENKVTHINNAIILFNDDLFYADKIRQTTIKLTPHQENRFNFNELKNIIFNLTKPVDDWQVQEIDGIDAYKLAAPTECELIASVTNCSLLNIHHNNDPLNIFRFHIANYFTINIVRSIYPNLVEQYTRDDKLAEEKEQHTLTYLVFCETDLTKLNLEHSDYCNTRKSRVTDAIERAQRKNKELCETHSFTAEVPTTVLSFSFFSPVATIETSINPKLGFLGESLAIATQEINKTPYIQLASQNNQPATSALRI